MVEGKEVKEAREEEKEGEEGWEEEEGCVIGCGEFGGEGPWSMGMLRPFFIGSTCATPCKARLTSWGHDLGQTCFKSFPDEISNRNQHSFYNFTRKRPHIYYLLHWKLLSNFL